MTDKNVKAKEDKPQDMVLINRHFVEGLLATQKIERKKFVAVQNDLHDILEQVKVVHQVTVNETAEMSKYDEDARDAQFMSVSLLREMTARFAKTHNVHKITSR